MGNVLGADRSAKMTLPGRPPPRSLLQNHLNRDSGPGLAVVALIQSVELHGLLKRAFLSQSLILVVWPTTTPSSIASLTSMLAIAARVSPSISGTVLRLPSSR